MKYSKELHDRLRNRTGLHGFNHFVGVDSGDIDALLDEIERLNSKCKRCNYHIAGYEDKDVINQWNTRSAIRKEFCPNCEAETPCTHEAELFVCDICGEDFAKYIVSRNCTLPDVSMTQDVLTDVKTPRSIENNNPDYYKDDVGKWIPV